MHNIMKLKIAVFLLLGVTVATVAQHLPDQMQKLMNAEFAINEYYVDSVKENKIVEDAINGMLEKLDPHSSYSDAEETKELNEPLQGNFGGVGIQFNMKQDTLYVIQTVAGGPSERVGILPGDRIVEVNDTSIAGVKMKNTEVMRRLRGPKGTKVRVLVNRHGEKINFVITRAEIPLFSIDASYMVDSKTGYIKISRFAETTHDEFMDAAKKLRQQGMTQLIIDLSDNGGGYLQAARDMADEFLKSNQLIVYTEGRTSPRYNFNSDGLGTFADGRLVVMVDQYSASASEIFTGAMQDWDRGVIVGRRTFGKGLVQRPFKFKDNSMMRLTIARYYTPSGRCIQKPYEKGDKDDYEKDLYNRIKDGELTNVDSVRFDTSKKYFTLNNHRVIYGGGGIMPDVFVPIDTMEYTPYYRDIMGKGSVFQFTIGYVDKHRAEIKRNYATSADFDQKFVVSDELMKDLVAAGTKDSVKYNATQYQKSENILKLIVKALIARDTYDNADYYRIVNHHNNVLDEAVKVINDEKRYNDLLLRSHYVPKASVAKPTSDSKAKSVVNKKKK
jgi:carboxyl-terminal processing protease